MNSNIKPTGASTSVAGISRTYKRILRQSFFMVIFDKRFDAAISQTRLQCNTAYRIRGCFEKVFWLNFGVRAYFFLTSNLI